MKATRRVFSAVLAFGMVLGMLPLSAFALDSTTLEASIQEARAYIDAITVNSSSNDPETVVKTFNSHFTWDNEKRENGKSYLFDWSYYNGVVFEGIEYLYEVTGDEQYKDYVVEYMSSLISADGTWATCSNNSSKECAGYNSTHGADCYKTASLLLDAYEMTGDGRYLTVAEQLYADLDTAAGSYSLPSAGSNFRHTWSADPSPDLWLDGLYMILPFRAEYAKHIADTEELDLIVSRMQWVSDNMYNSSEGLFYHAADSASSNSGTFWLRSIGWYAAAIVDIMDSMEGENLQSMKAQLVKLVNGMQACQNPSNGMWLNDMAATQSSSNPYETSGTALVCYAVMKAVNNGWLDESYADMAILAFNGICEEKLENNNLTDICFKGAPGSSNSTFYDNEGKGLGPFIMLCAEVVEYYNNLQDQPAPTETTVPENSEPSAAATLVSLEITAQPIKTKYFLNDTLELAGLSVEATFDDGTVRTFGSSAAEGYSITADTGSLGERDLTVSYTWKDVTLTDSCTVTVYERHFSNNAIEEVSLDVTVPGVTAVSFQENTNDIQSAVGNRFDRYFSYDITPTGYNQGESVNVTFAVPDGFTASDLVAFCVTDSTLTLIPGTYDSATNTYSFSVSHFSTYGLGDVAEVTGSGNLVGGIVYTLDTDGTIENDKKYLIVSGKSGEVSALTHANKSTPTGTVVNVINNSIVVESDTMLAWVFSDNPNRTITNNSATRYKYLNLRNSNILNGSSVGHTITSREDGEYRISYNYYYLRYNNGWKRGEQYTRYSVYLYEYTGASSGGEVIFTIAPLYLIESDKQDLHCTITVNGETVALKDCTIAWSSSDTDIITVSNGTVTAVSEGSANITATLSAADGTALQTPITLTIPVTVSAPELLSLSINNTDSLWTFQGQDADFSNVTLTATYSNGMTETVNADAFDYPDEVGTQTVTASYGNKTVTFPIQVKELSFVLDKESLHVQPEGTGVLSGIVTVDGIPAESYELTWVSANTETATVASGTVTGVQEGATTVTATLTEVNGRELSDPISLTAGITVAYKQVTSAKLQGSVPDVKVDGTPDYSGVSVIVTYEDGTTGTIPYGQLDFAQIDTSVPGMQRVTVTYGSYEFPLDVKVVISYDGLDDADMSKAPAYPDDGAVRIDKTATELSFDDTGIVEVELDVAGISVQSAVDVVLVVDVSNSMGWSLENAGNSQDADRIADDGQITKLEIAMDSVSLFADILLGDNNGSDSDNTLSFVTFAGYDSAFGKDTKDSACIDSLMEVFKQVKSAKAAKISFAGTKFTDNTSSYPLQIMDEQGNILDSGNNRGDTNYDYAFWQAQQTVAAIQQDNQANGRVNRTVYVVFITDGAPSHYNHNNKGGAGGRDDRVPSDTNTSYKVANDYDTDQNTWYAYFSGQANIYAKNLYDTVDGRFIAIGFDLAHGGFSGWQWTEPQLITALEQVAYHGVPEKEIAVHAANSAEELESVYENIANEIKYAGTSAQVTDLIGKGFTLQTAATSGGITVDPDTGIQIGQVANLSDYGITPHISIKAYDLWTKAETSDTELIGTRKTDADGNYSFTLIETVTFNQDGTEAYSNLLGENNNIMTVSADGSAVIAAKHFTYTRNADGSEDLHWIIGNITDKELAFSFLVYLDGSLDGQVPEGLVYTNESAKLEYIDINGQYAHKEFQSPAAAWGGASTAYEFYLVNDDGKPCDRSGNEIPFANRITITGPYFKELRLNQVDQELAEEIAAAYVLPPGYTLYDATAKYIVVTASGNKEGRLEISTPADGKAQTTVLVSATTPSYIQSRVAFGVKYNEIPTTSSFALTPDLAVIDYCKPISINIAANNTDVPDGYTTTLKGFYKYYDSVDQYHQYTSTSCVSPFVANYGIFTIEDGKAVYTPTKLVEGVEKVFAVFEIKTGANDTYYLVNELTVIPATVMYYETDGSVKDVFSYVDTWSAFGTFQDGKQDDYVSDTVTGKQIYGFDSSYENDPELSNGSSMYVAGKSTAANVMTGSPETVAKFTFKGTGFDLIARTGSQQATLRVHVTKQGTNDTKVISVICKGANELWQIPVISVKDLAPGTYNVEIIVYASYTANIPGLTQEQNAQLSRGNEFHFDAIRIYDPVKGNATAEAAYMTDGEYSQTISQIGQLLIDKATFQETTSSGVREGTGAVFMDSFTLSPDGDKITEGSGNFFQTSDVGTYDQYGPNNEVYLGQDQGIAFILNTNGTIPASIQIGAKSITGADVVLNAKLVSTNASGQNVVQTSVPPTSTIKTSTALYYELADAAELSKLFANGNQLYVVIWNTGTSVLSITDIKFAYTAAPQAAVTFLYSAELATVAADTISNYDEETYLRKLGDDWFYCNSEGNVIPYSGIVETSDSGMWYIVEGKVDFDFVGLFSTTNGIYSVRNGQVETSLNGIAERDGHWLYFQAGKVDTSFTGIAVYGNSGLWYVKDGVVQLDYSGPVTFDGATYQIENGNVAAS